MIPPNTKRLAFFKGFIFFVSLLLLPASSVFSQTLSISTAVVNSCTGNITVSVNGGTSPYAYEWYEENPAGSGNFTLIAGQTGNMITGFSAGNYRVVVTDASTPTQRVEAEYTLTNGFALLGALRHAGLVCTEDANSGVIMFAFGNGIAPFTWNLQDATNTQVANGLSTGNSLTIENLTVGSYTLNWRDVLGCVGTETINVTAPPVRDLVVNSTNNVSCFGGSDGSANITINGGWGRDYGIRLVRVNGSTETEVLNWTNIGTAQNHIINNLPIGNYRVYHLDRLLYPPFSTDFGFDPRTYTTCNKFVDFAITQPTELTHTISGEALVCFGDANGNVTGTISGGTAPYTISIDGSSPLNQQNITTSGGSFDFSGLTAGNYNFTITDSNGCRINTQASITQPTQVVSTFVSVTDAACNGGTDGSITISVTGGNAPYTFTVNGTTTTPTNVTGNNYTFGGLTLGNYAIIAIDQSGCSATVLNQAVNQPSGMNITIAGETLTCAGDSNGNITGTISGGTAPYVIRMNGTSNQINVPTDGGSFDFSGLTAGNYNFTITDSANCGGVAQADIFENQLQITRNITGITCAGFSDGAIDITPTNLPTPYTYQWTASNGGVIPAGQQNNQDLTNLIAGDYRVQITDANGCVNSRTYTVNAINVLNLNGVPTNYNGFGISANGLSDGGINVTMTGGTTPYSYSWVASNGGVIPAGQQNAEDLTGLVAGTYTLTVTDANGCNVAGQWTLTQPPALMIEEVVPSRTNVLCFGATTGVIEIRVTQASVAPYTYTLTNAGTGAVVQQTTPAITALSHTFSNLGAGTYNARVTDANGNFKEVLNIVITQPAGGLAITNPVISNYNGFGVSCNGATDGSIDITVVGGTPGYTYSWVGPSGFTATTQDVGGLASGNYTVTIRDATGVCMLVQPYTITSPAAVGLSGVTVSNYNGFEISGFGLSNGSIDITPTGGTGVYSYMWVASNGGNVTGQETNQDLTGLVAGDYQVTIIDQNGCTYRQSWTLRQPQDLLIQEDVASHVNVQCFGDTTGVIKIDITQGSVAPYTYTLTNAGTGAVVQQTVPAITALSHTFNNLGAGTYNARVTDVNGNIKDVLNIVISQPAGGLAISGATVSNFNGFGISCFGANDGSIDITVVGGTPAYSYSWAGPSGFTATTQDISGLSPGTYTVTIRDSTGVCRIVQPYTITEPTVVNLSGVTVSNYNGFEISGFGLSNGSIDITPAGGTGVYAYAWVASNGGVIPTGQASGQDLTGLVAGDYQVTVTDQNGCTYRQSWTLRQPQDLLIQEDVASHVNVQCFGDTTGVIKIDITQGSVAPYTYTLTNTGTGAVVQQTVPAITALSHTFNNLGAGTYNARVTDVNGNIKDVLNIVISQPAGGLAISMATVSNFNGFGISCFGANDGSIDITVVGGTPAYSYSWAGPSGFTATTQDISGLSPGTYTVTIRDSTGVCTINQPYTITEPTVVNLSGVTVSNYNGFEISGFGLSNGSIDITPAGGTGVYSYTWVASNGGVIPTGQASGQDLTGLVAGDYQVTIIDQNGCTYRQSWTLRQPQDLLIQEDVASHVNVQCFGDTTGVIKIDITQGSVAPYTYTLTNAGTGAVVQQTTPAITALSHTFNNLGAGTYNARVTDVNGNIKDVLNIVISQPAGGLAISGATVSNFNGFGISCFGANDGSIDITVVGGTPAYSYSWAGPSGFTATTQDISGLSPGTYTVTITDTTGVCRIVQPYTITEPTVVNLSGVTVSNYNGFEISGFGLSNGSIDITPAGGTGVYSYTWVASNGGVIPTGQANGQDLTGLVAGDYQVTVTDQNGCTYRQSWTLRQPQELLVQEVLASHVNVRCFGDATGVIEIGITQGSVAPYTYTLTNAGTGAVVQQTVPAITALNHTFSNLGAGTYNANVTDANGNSTQLLNILIDTISSEIIVGITTTDLTCYNSNNGSINLSVSGGVTPYTYTWSDLGGGPVRTNLAAGTYTVTITDNVGCQQIRQIDILNAPLFDISPVVRNISCSGQNDGSIELNLAGGQAPVVVTWADDASAGINRFNLAPGTYEVTITEGRGCSINRQFIIQQPAPLTLDGVITNAQACNDPNSGAIDLLVSGGTAPYTFNWNNGFASTEDLNNISANNYTVVVTDSRGCQATRQFTVVRPQPINAVVTSTVTADCNTRIVTQRNELAITGGVAPYTINWTGGGTVSGTNNEIMEATQSGTYTAEITDALGCVRIENIVIQLPVIGSASFTYTSQGLTQFGALAIEDPITFNNTSTGDAISYLWEFGDGTTSTTRDQTHTYSRPGRYEVRLTVNYPFNCSYTVSQTLDITLGYDLVIPNGFTPNGDNINDVIRPVFFGMSEVEMRIYDTWGSLIYSEKGGTLSGWNGLKNGKEAENGNYIMRVKATVFYGLVIEKSGPVTLIK